MYVKKKSTGVMPYEVAFNAMTPMPFRNESILTDFLKIIKRQEE